MSGRERQHTQGFTAARGSVRIFLRLRDEQEVIEVESIFPGAAVFLGSVLCPVRVSHSIFAVALREATSSLTGIKVPGSPGLGGSWLRAVFCLLVLDVSRRI